MEINELIIKSLESFDSSYSSGTVHSICEEQQSPAFVMDYPIPERYNKNKCVMLPVNPSRLFVYWEITDDSLKKNEINPEDVKLYFYVYNEKNEVLEKFESTFAVGEYYLEHQFEFKSLKIKVYPIDDENSDAIVSSNTLGVVGQDIKDDEVPNIDVLGQVVRTYRYNSMTVHIGENVLSVGALEAVTPALKNPNIANIAMESLPNSLEMPSSSTIPSSMEFAKRI